MTITGTNFGSNSTGGSVSVSPQYPTGWSSPTITYWSDQQIIFNITPPANDPGETVGVSVTSSGYGGYGFYGAPGQSGTSSQAQAAVTPKPSISGDYHDLWYFGPGITSQSAGASHFMYSVNLTANGTGAATWNITAGQNEIVLTPNGNAAKITSSGTTFSSTKLDVSVTVTMNGVTSDP